MKIAAIQHTAHADVAANLAVLEALIAETVQQQARLLVLPENFAAYGVNYRQFAEQSAVSVLQWCAALAQQHNIFLLAGSVPLLAPGNKVYASSVLFDPAGKEVARYHKLHLFDVDISDAQGRYRESEQFAGGSETAVAAIENLRLGLMICYDLRFPLLAQWLRDQGAELLVYPSAFTAKTGAAHWEVLLRARAIENGCWVLGANQCGSHSAKRQSYGHSMLINPWGEVVAQLDDKPGVLLAELDAKAVRRVREQLPVDRHQRLMLQLPDEMSHVEY